ncbi:MAG: Crp/Fnr family transcriptional regulator [Bulleidia sp.]
MSEYNHYENCPFRSANTTCAKSIRLFKHLPEHIQQELMVSARHINRPKGYLFAQDGDPVSSIIIIRSGSVRTCRIDLSGNEYILDVLHDGQAIWHDMFLKNAVYHYSIIANSDVSVCEIERSIFMEVLNRHPESYMHIIEMLSTELTAAKEKVLLLSIRSPLVRLCGFLLDQYDKSEDGMIRFRLEDIASTICLRPETISRCLRSMEKFGLIERKGQGKIAILNPYGIHDIYKNHSET